MQVRHLFSPPPAFRASTHTPPVFTFCLAHPQPGQFSPFPVPATVLRHASGQFLPFSVPRLAGPGGKEGRFAHGRPQRVGLGGRKACFAHGRPWRAGLGGKEGRFAHGKPWRAGLGGRKGLFAHGKPRRAGPGGKKGRFAHGRAEDGGMRRRAGVSTPGHGQGEGPDGYKFPHSGDAVDVGRGRSERSERSPARCWQTAGQTSIARSRGQEELPGQQKEKGSGECYLSSAWWPVRSTWW